MIGTMMNRKFLNSNTPQKFATTTVVMECIVPAGAGSSYCIGGVRQKEGDRSGAPLGQARDLEVVGKAKIIEGSERTEML